ncbi:MAG: hypothetical protein ACXVAX_04395 [Pseudobdellovibrio sp.]
MRSKLFISLLAVVSFVSSGCIHTESTTTQQQRHVSSVVADLTQPWAFDPGPDPNSDMGKELIDIVASQPYMPGISKEMTGDQKFRPAFGPTLWRMIQAPNSIKILFIGQDGTHIAEAAGRTATAGFGGRAQDMAAHFGVENSAAFMNTFAFTIKGQYAGYKAPLISEDNGQKKVDFNNTIADNGIWLMAQDLNSPMVKWRNKLIDWIMRNNKDSLRMVVLFGGPAKDSIGTFITAHGGQVGAKYTADDLANKKIKVPVFMAQNTGGNTEMPVPLDKNDKDMYATMGYNIPYDDLTLDPSKEKDPTRKAAIQKKIDDANAMLKKAQDDLNQNIDKWYPQLAISNGGVGKSGIVNPAQISGYDLSNIVINGKKTISMKGLKLSDGSTIQNDVVVAEFPHPTSLSSNIATAAQKVERALVPLKNFTKQTGWMIEEDPGHSPSKYRQGQPYVYGRADIGPAFYDFGTPKNRMVSVSSAYRMPGQPNIVVIGTRDKANFDKNQLAAATNAKPAAGISPQEMFSARPRLATDRNIYDRGPSEEMAKLMKENINMDVIGKMKDGKSADPSCKNPEPAGQFNIKTHPLCVGDFAYYRGTFDNPKVLILADPDGVDDMFTSRALTGTRGQYLQGLMDDMGIADQYLVLKTVPFGMDGATDQEWSVVLGQTNAYREKVIQAILASGKVKLVIADGKYAAQEIARINVKVPHVAINRSGTDNNSGIKEAVSDIVKTGAVPNFTAKLQMSNIPRSHLGFFSRVWEGTSGTRVFDAASPSEKGTAFAIVVPSWVYTQQNVVQSPEERQGIDALKNVIQQDNLPREDEKFQDFLQRGGGHDGEYIVFPAQEHVA